MLGDGCEGFEVAEIDRIIVRISERAIRDYPPYREQLARVYSRKQTTSAEGETR